MAEISPLRRRMIDDMMIRNLSPATQQSYLYAVAKFSRHFGRSPDRLGLEEVRAYQLHCARNSFAAVSAVISCIAFFPRHPANMNAPRWQDEPMCSDRAALLGALIQLLCRLPRLPM